MYGIDHFDSSCPKTDPIAEWAISLAEWAETPCFQASLFKKSRDSNISSGVNVLSDSMVFSFL